MNFQNIPRDLKVVKRAFEPKLGAFSFFDYKAVEPRLCAYFAAKIGYPEMAELIRSGIDPYTAVAKLVTGADSVTEQERQHWKVTYLSLMYGGGIRTICLQFDCKAPKAKSIIRQFHDAFPVVSELQEMAARQAARRGYIVTPWGRHLHPEQNGEHKLLNKLIQGSAADLMKQALIRVDDWLRPSVAPPESHMVSVIHDEIIFDGPVGEIEFLHAAVPHLMDDPRISEVVPILVDHEVSTTTWADKVGFDEWKGERP